MFEDRSRAVRLGLSVRDAAVSVGICRSRIYKEIEAGRLIARKCDRRTLILTDDLKAWLSSLPQKVST